MAAELAEVLGMPFRLEPPHVSYKREGVLDSLKQPPVTCTWALIIRDKQQKTTRLIFNLADDDGALLVGLDLQQYTSRDITPSSSFLKSFSENENSARELPIFKSETCPNSERARLDLIASRQSSKALVVTLFALKHRLAIIPKKIYRFTYAPYSEIVELLTSTGCLAEEAERIC